MKEGQINVPGTQRRQGALSFEEESVQATDSEPDSGDETGLKVMTSLSRDRF